MDTIRNNGFVWWALILTPEMKDALLVNDRPRKLSEVKNGGL